MSLAYLFLGLLLMVGVVACLRWLAAIDPAALARAVKWIAIALGAIGVGLLAFSGRIGLLVMAASVMLPLYMRWRGQRQRARAAAGPSGGQTSRIETAYIRVTLDHDTGGLAGDVLAGRFRGRQLSSLALAELLELLAECRAHDSQSVPLLETYLDREHGADWRGGEEPSAEQAGGAGSGAMSRAEAYQILGLQPGAATEEIKDAHRRLMLKLHPDRGGSTYLAAKINRAKDVLLGE